MAVTNIDDVFSKIEKDFVELSKTAARNAATKAQKDIKEKADKFIDEYYTSYSPKWYRRKKHLYKLVQRYYQEAQTAKGIKIEFGVEYSSAKIRGLHKSYSWYHQGGGEWISRMKNADSFNFDSKNNGIPDADWITSNFLEGIHPSGKLGDDGGVRDSQSPDEKMQKFFEKELESMVLSYMHKNLLDLISVYF